MELMGERIGMVQELGMARALRVLDMTQRSSPVAAGGAAGEVCAQFQAATSNRSLPGKNLAARAPGNRGRGRKTGAEAIRDLRRR